MGRHRPYICAGPFVDKIVFCFKNFRYNKIVMFDGTKKIFVAFVVLIVLAIAAIYFTKNEPAYESREFRGSVQKVEGNIIYAKGVFVVKDHPEFLGPEHLQDVQITSNSQTQYVRAIIKLPSKAELGPNGKFSSDTNNLQRESSSGILSDLSRDLNQPIRVLSKKNIFKNNKFEAAEIEYSWFDTK